MVASVRPPPRDKSTFLISNAQQTKLGSIEFLLSRGGPSPQLRCGPGPPAASSTAARHSRLSGKMGGIGAVIGHLRGRRD